METDLRSFYVPHDRVTYDGKLENPTTGEVYTPERRVKQSFLEECDINRILKQYSVTGQVRHISAKAELGAYLDLPEPVDYQESLHIVQEAGKAFGTLPSKTRERFGNDPQEFLAFMSDPGNQDEAIRLGLATRRPEPAPAPGDAGGAQKPPQAPSAPPAPPQEPEGS